MPLTHRPFSQDSEMLYSSNNVISSNLTPSQSPTPVVNAVQTTSLTTQQQYARIKKNDDGNISRQRSICELAGEVINYENVGSSSTVIIQNCNANENLTDITQQKNVQNPMFTIIEGNSNGDAPYGIVRKAQNRNHIKNNEDADSEMEEAQPRVISMFPPVARITGRRDCTNFAGDVTEKAEVAGNMLENNGNSLSDIVEEDDWEQSNEVILVDNTLYSG